MKHLQKQLLLEQIIYATIWVLILGTPLISFLLDDDRPLEGGKRYLAHGISFFPFVSDT